MDVNYKDILKMAIGNEIEAYDFYTVAAEKSKDRNMKVTFTDLATEEMKHRKTLEGFLNNETIQMNFQQSAIDYKIAEATSLPALTAEMSFVDGIALAMKKEQEAMEMYQRFADASVNDEQKKIFIELTKMELGHKLKLEDLFTNTAHVEVW